MQYKEKAGEVRARGRLGHTRLNNTMHLINKHPSGLCEHCQIKKPVVHVLFHCQKNACEQDILKREIRKLDVKEVSLTSICF